MVLNVLDLFSGVGGSSLGLERTGGFQTCAFCEIEEFQKKVLRKNWPNVKQYSDVMKLSNKDLERDGLSRIDVITGGFPCQDVSIAGRQAGMGDGTRSGLWSEIIRLTCELRPKYIIVENVAALLSGPANKRGGWFGRVLGDLAECGYDAEWENIPAASVGAPHRRERVWIVAYPSKERLTQSIFSKVYGVKSEWNGEKEVWGYNWKFPEMGVPGVPLGNGRLVGSKADRVDDGFSDRPHRLACTGNAVVPKIAELIGLGILSREAELSAPEPVYKQVGLF